MVLEPETRDCLLVHSGNKLLNDAGMYRLHPKISVLHHILETARCRDANAASRLSTNFAYRLARAPNRSRNLGRRIPQCRSLCSATPCLSLPLRQNCVEVPLLKQVASKAATDMSCSQIPAEIPGQFSVAINRLTFAGCRLTPSGSPSPWSPGRRARRLHRLKAYHCSCSRRSVDLQRTQSPTFRTIH